MSILPTDPKTLTLREKAEIVETSEANMFRDILDGLSPDLAEEYGGYWRAVGGATVSFLLQAPTTAYNKVIGLGVHKPATEAMVDEIITLYNHTKTTFGVAVSPVAQPAQLTDWLLERGFAHSSNSAKMIRGTEPPAEIRTDLRIEPVTKREVSRFAHVGQVVFKRPDVMGSFFEKICDIPNVFCYLAYAEDVVVGVGSMVVSGNLGALFSAATLPEFRRRGAQGALMARRIRDGIELGCQWFTTETDLETPDTPNPSFRNMLRAGFQLAYLRPFYEYEFE